VTDTRILVVDDEAPLRRMMARILERHGYSCATAGDAEEAREKLESEHFALLLTDVNMPGESGLDLIVETRSRYPDLATIMVTGVDDPSFAEMALQFGAYGYVIKPFEQNEILINVSNALRRRTLEEESRQNTRKLEQMVSDRTSDLWMAVQKLEATEWDLRLSREETVERLAIAAEYRDDKTASHIHRMSRCCALLAARAGLESERCELIRMASLMHDVGKIGIPDHILLKPGKLTTEEFEVVKTHAAVGHRILSGSSSKLLQVASVIALTHHERYDGSGYPNGLSGTDIPVEGRIAAVADVFDALTNDRVYRPAFTLDQAVDMMTEERGTHFDPTLLDLLLDSMDEVVQINSVAG
jgi:putative two-component system response regulator